MDVRVTVGDRVLDAEGGEARRVTDTEDCDSEYVADSDPLALALPLCEKLGVAPGDAESVRVGVRLSDALGNVRDSERL